VSSSGYVPSRGDVVWVDLSRRMGREQSGHRPALIVSPEGYNRRAELALICPITSRVKGYPFEVGLPHGSHVAGVVLADHIRSVDWRARQVEQMGHLPVEFVEAVTRKVSKLLP
jgi:mRNA interferase MazF